jgi:hypothetical protein
LPNFTCGTLQDPANGYYSNIVLSFQTSMDDPALSIAAIKIGTRIVFRFKLLDSPILVYVLPAPKCVKSAAHRSLYPVTPILKLADACVSEIIWLVTVSKFTTDSRNARRRRLSARESGSPTLDRLCH